MILYLVRRFINYVILTLVATTLCYLMVSAIFEPAARYRGQKSPPSEHTINRILDSLGVNPHTPLLERAWNWLSNLVFHFDFGLKYDRSSVAHDMWTRAGVSLQLLLIGTLLGVIFGVLVGVSGAIRQYRLSDHVATYSSFLIISTPVFVIGILLMIVMTRFNNAIGHQLIVFTGHYSPGVTGFWPVLADRLSHLALPTVSLALVGLAIFSRYQRMAMLDVLNEDYIRTARAKGRTRGAAMMRHGVRIALIPMSTLFSYYIVELIAGSAMLEKIFSWHGMGEFLINSVLQNDINAAAGAVFFAAVLVLIASTLAEFLFVALDPRARA